MISTIQINKRPSMGPLPVPPTITASVTAAPRLPNPLTQNIKPQNVSNAEVRRQQQLLAPLASLDCSITEPLTDSHNSTTETPTLSGYFDCDQLSDMVDDSLFEITNAGCLSKSVFNGRQLMVVSPIGEETFIMREAMKDDKNIMIANESSRDDNGDDNNDDSNRDQDSGTITPTNEGPPNDGLAVATETSIERPMPLPQSHQLQPGDPKQPSQVAMMAGHQAYDYSSTSTIPAQSIRWAQQGAGSGGHRQRSRSARFPSSGPSVAQVEGCEESPMSGVYKSRRKARSNPDVRDQPQLAGQTRPEVGQEEVCLECRQLAATQHHQQQRPDFSPKASQKKKEKRRFTFSLFNLFSGGTTNENQLLSSSSSSSHDDKKAKNGSEICTHKHQTMTSSNSDKMHSSTPPTNNRNHHHHHQDGSSKTSAGGRRRSSATRDNNTTATNGSKIKSRDSIRLMNQKKQREMRMSQTFTDFQNTRQPQTNELLLNLTQNQTRPGVNQQMRSSQSSYSVMKSGNCLREPQQLDNSTGSGNGNGIKSLQQQQQQQQQQRQTKSVKFTMHDKVLIVPSGPGKRPPGSSNPPPAYLQPMAPIIKRSVPKSTSFSQTESNRSLEELLAKYEVNNELIAELNERLKLTETIASPISILDQVNYDNSQDTQGALHKTATTTNYSNNNTQTIYALNQTNDRMRTDIVNTCCDPNNLPTSSSLQQPSGAENAGFSRDWLHKQHRGLI